MLFERFVFVLYLLFVYAWFLLGALYDSEYRYVPLLSMLLTLLSVTVVTMFQLQRIVKRSVMEQADRWSTLAWSLVHMCMSILFLLDSLEWVNVLVVLSVAGLGLTVMIMVVGVCSCYVIILNGRDWAPHIHLTCICFWVLVQYMSVRLPLDGLQYVTTVPVVAMAALRVYEHVEDGVDRWSALEICLWCACIVFHIFLDVGLWSARTFYWCLLAVVCVMSVLSPGSRGTGGNAADTLAEAQHRQAMLESANRLEGPRLAQVQSTLQQGASLTQGQELVSGAYKLAVTADGDLELSHGAHVEWSSHTGEQGTAPFKLMMQDDGNLVLLDGEQPPAVLWESATDGRGEGPYSTVLLASGAVVVYGRTGSENSMLWSSNPRRAHAEQALPSEGAGPGLAHEAPHPQTAATAPTSKLVHRSPRQQTLQEEGAAPAERSDEGAGA